MSWPPITMATQHPDNASVPWWRVSGSGLGSGSGPGPDRAFVPTQDEIDELLLLFRELPIDEYMWDWEGKFVDESVGEKLYGRAGDFFAARPLGEDLHFTYRIPAFDGTSMRRMARAFMNVLSMADLGVDLRLRRPPVTELFLPLTTSADQLVQVRQAFSKVAGYHRQVFHDGDASDPMRGLLEVTPLIEDVDSIFGIEAIIRPYWESLLRERKTLPRGQRVFLARSDPAMNAGLVPAVLAIKAALSIAHRTGESLGFPVHPVIGTGSLPFRGSVNPTYLETFLAQYAGVATYSIQSAFRYDYPLDVVRGALETIRREVPRRPVVHVPDADLPRLRELAGLFSQYWKPAIEPIAGLINAVARHVPPRRERMQHIGLFGYSRGVGEVRLPRAIGFTCALYSLGIPPELITTGRGLIAAEEHGLLPLLDAYYPALRADLQHAGKYFNRENLSILASGDAAFAGIRRDVEAIERILGLSLGPEKPHHTIHRNLTSTILLLLKSGGDAEDDRLRANIVEAGKIRRSLG